MSDSVIEKLVGPADRQSTDDDLGPCDPEIQLSGILAELARKFHREHDDFDSVLSEVCESARTAIPGSEHAGITLITENGKLDSRGATGELPALIDKMQEELRRGPCIDAAHDEQVVLVTDMSKEERWGGFSETAASAGVGSMLSFQLWVEKEHIGALNMYSSKTDAFDDGSADIGLPLATHASVAIAAARREQQLRDALDSRDVIGQAKGMLMQRYSIDSEQAFDLLVRLSQQSNTKARDIAESITKRGLD
ncbi:GAF and ANTAR domain-containing protein [Antrihabitans spumae]|uniref:GAF and ANTAR domain-containing protein n=1 Tax=Antrihabitans spumae TaxID=3373370 RepID=A0ABW7KB22_9NOCA